MTETIGIRLALAVIIFIIGLYLLWCGIKVRGMVYSNESLHTSSFYPTYVKIVRICCFALTFVFSVNAACNSMSFGSQNRLDDFQGVEVTSEYIALQSNAKMWYGISTWTLIASISAIVIMLLLTTYLTSKYMPSVTAEKLSGNHPAFKKKDKK